MPKPGLLAPHCRAALAIVGRARGPPKYHSGRVTGRADTRHQERLLYREGGGGGGREGLVEGGGGGGRAGGGGGSALLEYRLRRPVGLWSLPPPPPPPHSPSFPLSFGQSTAAGHWLVPAVYWTGVRTECVGTAHDLTLITVSPEVSLRADLLALMYSVSASAAANTCFFQRSLLVRAGGDRRHGCVGLAVRCGTAVSVLRPWGVETHVPAEGGCVCRLLVSHLAASVG